MFNEPTNEERAARIPLVLDAHIQAAGGAACEAYLPCDLSSLLTDIRHYCEKEGFDFDTILTMSEIHWNDEKEDRP